MTPDPSNIRHGYLLATWLQRLIAHVIDRVIVVTILLVSLFGMAVGLASGSMQGGMGDGDRLPLIERPFAGDWGWGLVAVAAFAFLIYAMWFLAALGRGQTPGKQIVGVRVIRANGEPSDWGRTFVREVVIEWIVVSALSAMTGGIFYVVNYVWPLWDKDRQALHDKMVETLVVDAR